MAEFSGPDRNWQCYAIYRLVIIFKDISGLFNTVQY